jgi:hypothetical protein
MFPAPYLAVKCFLYLQNSEMQVPTNVLGRKRTKNTSRAPWDYILSTTTVPVTNAVVGLMRGIADAGHKYDLVRRNTTLGSKITLGSEGTQRAIMCRRNTEHHLTLDPNILGDLDCPGTLKNNESIRIRNSALGGTYRSCAGTRWRGCEYLIRYKLIWSRGLTTIRGDSQRWVGTRGMHIIAI